MLALLGLALAGTVKVDVLDIGQGDAVLVRTAGRNVLIDAGDRDSDTVDQLKELGVYTLDLVIASHPHSDHIGRMADVLSSFDVGLYLDSGVPHTTKTYASIEAVISERGIKREVARRGRKLQVGEAKFTILGPSEPLFRETRSDLNSNSVIVLMEHGKHSMLFTGDAEEPTEHRLVSQGVPKVDILKVPHHGSSHSSTRSFLGAVDAKWALISAGSDNPWGHPERETLDRISASGSTAVCTCDAGRISVISTDETLTVKADGRVLGGAPRAPEETAVTIELPTATLPPPPAPAAPLSKKEQRKRAKELRKRQY